MNQEQLTREIRVKLFEIELYEDKIKVLTQELQDLREDYQKQEIVKNKNKVSMDNR